MYLTGCSTIYTLTEFSNAKKENNEVFCKTIKYLYDDNPVVYSGTYQDIYGYILFPHTCHGEGCFGIIVYPVMLIGGLVDLPLSFVADTLMLPYTIPLAKNMDCKEIK